MFKLLSSCVSFTNMFGFWRAYNLTKICLSFLLCCYIHDYYDIRNMYVLKVQCIGACIYINYFTALCYEIKEKK